MQPTNDDANGGRPAGGQVKIGGWERASIQIERASLKIHTQADIDREASE
jgi:hypothetical protein